MMENIFFIKVSYYLQNSFFTNLALKKIRKTALKEHLPIEQGLRRFEINPSIKFFGKSQRASSYRTRIKTQILEIFMLKLESQRASSYRTRIKTLILSTSAVPPLPTQRASSYRTRIKTWLFSTPSGCDTTSKSIFL